MNSKTSSLVPLSVKSPVCNKTSPSGTLNFSEFVLLWVSEIWTNLIEFDFFGSSYKIGISERFFWV